MTATLPRTDRGPEAGQRASSCGQTCGTVRPARASSDCAGVAPPPQRPASTVTHFRRGRPAWPATNTSRTERPSVPHTSCSPTSPRGVQPHPVARWTTMSACLPASSDRCGRPCRSPRPRRSSPARTPRGRRTVSGSIGVAGDARSRGGGVQDVGRRRRRSTHRSRVRRAHRVDDVGMAAGPR